MATGLLNDLEGGSGAVADAAADQLFVVPEMPSTATASLLVPMSGVKRSRRGSATNELPAAPASMLPPLALGPPSACNSDDDSDDEDVSKLPPEEQARLLAGGAGTNNAKDARRLKRYTAD